MYNYYNNIDNSSGGTQLISEPTSTEQHISAGNGDNDSEVIVCGVPIPESKDKDSSGVNMIPSNLVQTSKRMNDSNYIDEPASNVPSSSNIVAGVSQLNQLITCH